MMRPLQNSDKRLDLRRTGTEKPQHTEVCEDFEYRSNAKVRMVRWVLQRPRLDNQRALKKDILRFMPFLLLHFATCKAV